MRKKLFCVLLKQRCCPHVTAALPAKQYRPFAVSFVPPPPPGSLTSGRLGEGNIVLGFHQLLLLTLPSLRQEKSILSSVGESEGGWEAPRTVVDM